MGVTGTKPVIKLYTELNLSKTASMKHFLTTFLLFTLSAAFASAQTFSDGLELYQNEQFEEALAIFSQFDDDHSSLYKGKIYFNNSNYYLAERYFRMATESDRVDIRQEAEYTLALTQFRLKQYDKSLETLRQLIESDNRTRLRLDSQRLYRQILNYLSIGERFQTLQRVSTPSIRYDLVNQSKTFVDQVSYEALVQTLLRMEPDSTVRSQLIDALQPDSQLNQFFERYPTAPAGMVYNIGVLLPAFEENDPDFTIPRNLYFGLMLAADEFNSRNSDKKIRLSFKNSAVDADTSAKAFTQFVMDEQVDAVIGPLFSQPAQKMAQLAEEFQTIMLAPLANSDELNLDYNYTFQLNPTFEVHGRNMARFAVQELGLDTLAVITETGSLGRAAANSFRHEAERLGAHISYYIEENFAAIGYDVTGYTEIFTPDQALIDSLGYTPTQGLYAPFTGQAASTLTNLLLNDLEALRSDVVIMGSEEWADVNLTAFQRRLFEIYHTESFRSVADSSAVDFFEQDFETRFGVKPDQMARVGYDTGTYLFQSLETAGNPIYLGRVLRTRESHNGMSLRIHFDGKRINQNVFIRPVTPKAIERINPPSTSSFE